jgi:hypothetical protein
VQVSRLSIVRIVVLGVCASLAACASGGPGTAPQPLAPGVTMTLPDAPPFGDGANAFQLVQARYHDHRQNFQSIIQSTPGRFAIVMTVPSGPRILSIEWHEGVVSSKKEPIAPGNLVPERLLADLMLVYAPEEVLRDMISGGKLVTVGDRVRRVFKDGRELIEVTRPAGDPWSGEATLTNFSFDYALDIQSRRLSQ